MKQISYFEHEAAMARLTSAMRKMLIALIIMIAALIVNNIVWINATYHTQEVIEINE